MANKIGCSYGGALVKPIIGITSSVGNNSSVALAAAYVNAIVRAGGTPIVLPNLTNKADIDCLVGSLDGLLVTGGGDIDPTRFNEEPLLGLGEVTPDRDTFELALVPKVIKADKPVFGICRGIQVLAIATGGSMYQDIYSQINDRTLLQHQQKAPRGHASHFVTVKDQTLLHQIVGSERMKVNSFHHQTVRDVGKGFKVTANSSDGIIEAIESTEHRFVLGVQWHPECLFEAEDATSKQLFEAFVKAASQA